MVAGMAIIVAFQEKLVYVPVLPGLTKSYPITPARLRLSYEDVWLRSSDGVRLHAWFIKLFPDCRGLYTNSDLSTPITTDLASISDFKLNESILFEVTTQLPHDFDLISLVQHFNCMNCARELAIMD